MAATTLPRIHFVRHGEAYHNLSPSHSHIHDPVLTRVGEQQCEQLRRTFPLHTSISIIITSPLKRCLQTAILGFPATISPSAAQRASDSSADTRFSSSGDPVRPGRAPTSPPLDVRPRVIIAQPLFQETSDLPCDTGTPFPTLIATLPALFGISAARVDLSALSETEWPSKSPGGPYAPRSRAVEARARRARQWLRLLSTKGHTDVAVVCHAGFLAWLTGARRSGWVTERAAHDAWDHCEWRSYEFVSADDRDATLRETRESCARRGVEEGSGRGARVKIAPRKLWREKIRKGSTDKGAADRLEESGVDGLKGGQQRLPMENRDWVGGYD